METDPYRVPSPPPEEPKEPQGSHRLLSCGLLTLVSAPLCAFVTAQIAASVFSRAAVFPAVAVGALVGTGLPFMLIKAEPRDEHEPSWSSGIGMFVAIGVVLLTALFGAVAAIMPGEPGRPYRVGGVPLRRRTRGERTWSARSVTLADVPEAEKAALAGAWERAAAMEHASIAAFAVLAKDLAEAGAPPALVRRCLEAALEEVRHAEDAFAIASVYAGEPRGPAPRRAPFARLAAESVVDGCLNEGRAADDAERALACASDPAVRDALARVADDEARHAELAEDIVRFCIAEGGAAARTAARAALSAASRSEDVPRAARARALLDEAA